MKHRLFGLKSNFLIGEFLWKERLAAKRSYEDVAFELGISKEQLRQYELGTTGVPLATVVLLAQSYGVEKAELYYFIEDVLRRSQLSWSVTEYGKIVIHRFRVWR